MLTVAGRRWLVDRCDGGGGGARRRRLVDGGHVLVVDPHVARALVAAREASAADVAWERLLAGVRAHVRRQVVAAAERAPTHGTRKRSLPGVDAQVARQLVATREPTLAAGRRARERPLVDRHRRATAAPRRRPRRAPTAGAGTGVDGGGDSQVHRLHLYAGKFVVDVGGGGRRLDRPFRRRRPRQDAVDAEVEVAQLDRRRRRRRRRDRRRPDAGRGRRGGRADVIGRRRGLGRRVTLFRLRRRRLDDDGLGVTRQPLHLPVEHGRQQFGRHVLRRQRRQRRHRARRRRVADGRHAASDAASRRQQPRRDGGDVRPSSRSV